MSVDECGNGGKPPEESINMTQEETDRMITGSPVLDPRDAVGVAFRNYERSIAAPLRSVLDREWKGEDLYAISQIAANAITYRDRKIAQLKKDYEFMRERLQWLYDEPDKPRNTLSSWQRLVVQEALGLSTGEPAAFKCVDSNVSCVGVAFGGALGDTLKGISNTPEKWIVEFKDSDGVWKRSRDCPEVYPSESAANIEIDKVHKHFGYTRRAVQLVDVW